MAQCAGRCGTSWVKIYNNSSFEAERTSLHIIFILCMPHTQARTVRVPLNYDANGRPMTSDGRSGAQVRPQPFATF